VVLPKRGAGKHLTFSTDYVKDIRAANPRVLLLDVKLPGTDGYHVCAKIKENYGKKPIKIFMVTARPRDEVAANVAASGADGYLLKPFGLSELDRLVSRI
jgi:DNA-binding response OmpR family regulator